MNLDIYDDLEREVQEAARGLILPTENADKLIPSLNTEDPPQQDPLMRVPVRGINMEEVGKVGGSMNYIAMGASLGIIKREAGLFS